MYQDLKPFSGFSFAETLDTYPLRIYSDSSLWLANAKSYIGLKNLPYLSIFIKFKFTSQKAIKVERSSLSIY
jgi:hypothetical protein